MTETTETTTTADAVDVEREGLATLGQYPAVVAKLVSLAERAATRKADYGDVTAEAASLAVALFARTIGTDGMPADETERAILVAVTAKRAAEAAREAARRQWAPRGKREAVDVAPNSLGRWTEPKLVARAERYTNGKLSTRTQAAAVLDQRQESSLPRIYHGPRVPRHSGGTAPAAEAVYWSTRRSDVLATALESAFALSGVDVATLTDPSCWSRRGGIHWSVLAATTARDRGTVRREVRRAAAAAVRAAEAVTAAP